MKKRIILLIVMLIVLIIPVGLFGLMSSEAGSHWLLRTVFFSFAGTGFGCNHGRPVA